MSEQHLRETVEQLCQKWRKWAEDFEKETPTPLTRCQTWTAIAVIQDFEAALEGKGEVAKYEPAGSR